MAFLFWCKRSPLARLVSTVSLAATIVSSLTACGSDSTPSSPPPGPTPTLGIAVATQAFTVIQGDSITTPVNVTRGGGFAGAVDLALDGASAGVTGAFTPARVEGTGTSTTLVVRTTATTPPGALTLTVKGTGTGVPEATSQLQLTVAARPIPVASVAVTPATDSLEKGKTRTFAATVRDADNNVLAGRQVQWATSDAAIATVNAATGAVAAVAPGTATITATSEGKSGTATVVVYVPVVAVASVSVAPALDSLKPGQTHPFAATVRDAQHNVLGGRVVRWTSANPVVATVDSVTGVVRAIGAGTTTIRATSEGISGTASLKVQLPVASVTIAPGLDTLEAYDVRQIAAVLRDAEGRVLVGRVVRWSSSNPAVASIDSITGALTGIDRGTVTVTATSEGISGTTTRVVVIKYRSITAGSMHACDLASGGIAWCWGLNGREARIGSAQLGDNAHSTVPVRVPGGLRFSQISTYGSHNCGVTLDRKAYCWGYNAWGMLGAGTNVPQSAMPLAVAGNMSFLSVTVGSNHSCGVSTDNRGWCWGNNEWRQLGTGTATASAVPVEVAGGLRFRSIAAGAAATCGITLDGATYCWGANSLGQLGDGGKISYGNTFIALPNRVAGNATFASVSLGSQYTCALTPANAAFCWGGNNARFGNGNGGDSSTPVPAGSGRTFRSLSAGYGHVCAVSPDDTAWCWGSGGNGRLGVDLVNGSNVPVRAGGTLKFADVAAAGIATGSAAHSCGISADRLTVYCWGRNDVGQLGNGATTSPANGNPVPSIVVTQKPLPW